MTKEEYFYSETNKHIRNVQLLMNEFIKHLLSCSRVHDVTKFDDIERPLFTEVIPRLSKYPYGSEGYKEALRKIRPAVDHHNKYNFHHPENHTHGIRGMNLIWLVEMLCDWMAASKRNPNDDIVKSIEMNQERFGYSDDLKEILINTTRIFSQVEPLLEEHHKWAE